RVPDSEFKGPVTLRQILSHTAGFTQHGFADYQPGEELPTLLQTLNGSGPAKNDPIVVDFTPGSDMRYSGGGVQVSQLVIEDVTGLSYEQAARTYVFEPLKMSRSTFAEPTGNVACAHDSDGKPRALPRCYESMPESAASGLWTTAGDLGKFVVAIMGDEAFLPASLRAEMASRVPGSWHGLGPRVNGKALHHGGANDSYRAWIEGHPESGDGVVILTNGEGGRPLAYELRLAVERAYGWDVHFPDDFKAP
ncbi:MAG: serine hydrolase domain-containing protein, partial [Myxococcota bacterium]